MQKYVYSFKEGNKKMNYLLGGKGANLAQMTNLGLPVPQGFIVSTEACLKYYENNQKLANFLIEEIDEKVKELENLVGKKLGDLTNPLLLSIRSGARASMPGMMDTILNLGLNDEVAKNFSETIKNPVFVYDSYRRFIQMFADVVMGISKNYFEEIYLKFKENLKIKNDHDLTEEDLQMIIQLYKKEYQKLTKKEFPHDPKEQLFLAIQAVFKSWNNERAVTYRRLNDIPSNWGTAVNVQEMVYGNLNDLSGSGVAFTRNPATGEKKLYGEYLINAQGEDIVAGIRTPETIDILKEKMPNIYEEFINICDILEHHYQDMQDLEFTIESGKLYILQTRNGKRTAKAALKIAIDLVNEGMITKNEALLKVDPKQLDQLLHPVFDEEKEQKALKIGTGLAASPGSATGKIYFTANDAIKAHKNGEKDIILVRRETSPEDINGMAIAHGILTLRGGMTSHAAVVARGMGICCVSGCTDLMIDEHKKLLITKAKKIFKEGDYISLNGSLGIVYGEEIATKNFELTQDFKTFMTWTDEVRTLKIRANADNAEEAKMALNFKAEGIGLCRTEHMFFKETRIFDFRCMILADSKQEREKFLNKLLEYQTKDFEELFEVMNGYPVTIRYLDPPLHEFLPNTETEIKSLAKALNINYMDAKKRIDNLKEFNPMMGHRGVRLAITYPEIVVMQTKAIVKALINTSKLGYEVKPELMIPLINDVREIQYVKKIIEDVINLESKNESIDLKYQIGTMIETPRACITAEKIAKEVDFFSFGTNDLTQLTYGFSRDDAAKFLDIYYQKQVFDFDPFIKIDQECIGVLLKIACQKSKLVNSNFKLGICGEHAGNPASVEIFHNLGLDYVSCSPYRIPIAKLSAAQANLRNPR